MHCFSYSIFSHAEDMIIILLYGNMYNLYSCNLFFKLQACKLNIVINFIIDIRIHFIHVTILLI